MNVNEAMRVLLVNTIEREQAIIEAFKSSAEWYFKGVEIEPGRPLGLRAKSIIADYVDNWEDFGFIPDFEGILTKIRDEYASAEAWRKQREAMKEATKGEVNPCN